MAKKPRRPGRPARTEAQVEQTRNIGHLLVKFQGKYYYVPSDKIQGPLQDDDPNVMKYLDDEVARLTSDEHSYLIGLEFAMEIAPAEAAGGMAAAKKRT